MNRRQFLTSSTIGALLGAAWGARFLASEVGSEYPTVTINRSPGLFSMLIEHESARVLLLDGDDGELLSETTEGTAGFLRQRIDVVLAADSVLRNIRPDFVDRWNISALYPLPDQRRPYSSPLDVKALSVGGLEIEASEIPFGTWRATAETTPRLWNVSVRFGWVCCLYGSSRDALEGARGQDNTDVTMLITNDPNWRELQGIGADILAIPEDALESVDRSTVAAFPFELVRLYRNYPVSMQLRSNSIIVPSHY